MLIYKGIVKGKRIKRKRERKRKTNKQMMEEREDKNYAENLPNSLRGIGHQTLTRPRGLRGSKFGPAGECKNLTEEEKQKIEGELRNRGLI